MNFRAEPTVEDVERLTQMGTWIWTPDDDRVWWSAGLQVLLSIDLAGDTDLDALVGCLHPQDQPTFRDRLELACRTGDDIVAEYRVGAAHALRWMQCRAQVQCDAQGRIERAIGVFRDITSERIFLEELAEAAIRDPLTGLLNRFAIADRLEHALERLRRHERQVAVMFVDLDGLKEVNDRLGHHQGDEVLRAVATRLTEVVRHEDSVGRFGGDEFVIVCEDILTPDHAMVIANRIVERIQLTPETAPLIHITTSVGVTAARESESGAEVLARSDEAMYEAKRRGGGQVVFRS